MIGKRTPPPPKKKKKKKQAINCYSVDDRANDKDRKLLPCCHASDSIYMYINFVIKEVFNYHLCNTSFYLLLYSKFVLCNFHIFYLNSKLFDFNELCSPANDLCSTCI